MEVDVFKNKLHVKDTQIQMLWIVKNYQLSMLVL